jgi:5-methylcytosine-specific restriction endonuclease McrA
VTATGELPKHIGGASMFTIVTKKCSNCGEVKTGKFFKSQCADCIYEKQRIYHDAHKEEISEYQRKYTIGRKDKKREYDKQRRTEKADELKQTKKAYYEKNKDTLLKKNKEYRKSIPEKMLEYCRAWKKRHKDKVNESTRNRRARIKGNGGIFTKDEWLEILEKYGHRCLRCRTTERIEADHVVPIALGGLNVAANIQPLCRICNASKGDTIADYRT